jgi:tetratricopeptide (TPR) repeat protein
MEDFATSMKLYSDLTQSKSSIEQEDEDIASNYSAARAQNTWTTGIGHGDDQTARDSHEVCFNLAYELIALGKLDQAEEALNRAESMTILLIFSLTLELCARSGLSGDELKAEQGIILTQLAFIKQLREPVSEEATKLYDDVQNQPYISPLCSLSNFNRSVDAATRAIALNNQLCIEPRSNPFESHRLHVAASHAFGSSKPFLAQSRPFSANSLLLSSQAHKSRKTAAVKKHQKSFPLDYSASLVQLYSELNGQSETVFFNKLDAIFRRDETDLSAGLMLVQVQMQRGNTQMASATLEKILHALKDENAVKYAPGLVSLAVLLFPKVGKDDKATALLMDAKAYWSVNENSVSRPS